MFRFRIGRFFWMGLIGLLILGDGVIALKLLEQHSAKPTLTQSSQSTYKRTREEIPIDRRAPLTKPTQSPTRSSPWGVAIDSHRGIVWVAETNCNLQPACTEVRPSWIAAYSQFDGKLLKEYHQPEGYSSPLFLAVDPIGNVWFTQPTTDSIGKLAPDTATWSQWHLPKGNIPCNLLFDSHGNLWFTNFGGNSVGFMNPQTLQIALHILPVPDSHPFGITSDKQGTIWIAQNGERVGKLASFVPALSGPVTFQEHDIRSLDGNRSRPYLLVADQAGHIWYSQEFAGVLGEYDPVEGSYTNYLVKAHHCPSASGCTYISGIAIDQQSRIWFTDSLGGRVGYLVPRTDQVVTLTLPNPAVHPHVGLLIDTENTVWFTEQYGLALNRYPINVN